MKRAWQNFGYTLLFLLLTACATSSQQAQDNQDGGPQSDDFSNEAGDEEDAGDNATNKNAALDDEGDGGADKNNAENAEFDLAAEDSGNLPYVNDDATGANGAPANANADLGPNANLPNDLGVNATGNGNLFAEGNVINNAGNALPENVAPQGNLGQNAITANQGVINPVPSGNVPANVIVPPANVPANTASANVAAPANAANANVAANANTGGSLLDLAQTRGTGKSTLNEEFRTGESTGESDQDVEPDYAQVRWVGYNFDKNAKKLKVEIVTRGGPTYEVRQEKNRANQPELVIRFFEAVLRQKSARPLDASEFRSPVAYVRMRANDDEHYVDVVMTLRDQVKPKLFAKDGSVQVTFDIPEYYFGNSRQEIAQKIGSAENLAAADILPTIEEGSEAPRRAAFVPDPAAKAFEGAPVDGGQSVDPVSEPAPDPTELPPSFEEDAGAISPDEVPPEIPANETINFENSAVETEGDVLSAFHVQRFAIAAVAQDNLENNANAENGGNANNANANANRGNGNAANNAQANGNANLNANANANANLNNGNVGFGNNGGNVGLNGANAPANAVAPINNGGGNLPFNNGANNFVNDQGGGNVPANGNVIPPSNVPANGAPINNALPLNNGGNALLENAPANIEPEVAPAPETTVPAAPDVVGNETEGAPSANGAGRPISIEFHRAPLHLVLKTFGDESGNNFTYPADVANTEITIRLRQVPWDEALKAILETYGLGMVQVGQNVVRIDRLARMNEYLKDLNTVRQYREQLEPTKILVMRLSHGTAKEVETQMKELLKTDIEKDPRIKITADERTNSIVAEAATQTLSKIKNVVERLDLETPQVRIASRIVEVSKSASNFFGILWSNTFNFDPGRGLGLGSLPFPNSVNSDFTVDPGVSTQSTSGNLTMRFGSLNRFIDLDLLLKMEERKGTTNILQNNNVLVLDRQRASILAGSSQFFRPAAGGNVISQGGTGQAAAQGNGLAEVTFNLSLDVVPQVTAVGSINMKLIITSDTPGDPKGEQLATKNTRRLETTMARKSGETAVIGGIYDTKRTKTVVGVPYLSDIPILGLLFKSTLQNDSQTELLIMVTPTLVGIADNAETAYQDGFASAPAAAANGGGDEGGDEDPGLDDEGVGNLQGDGGGNENAGNPNTTAKNNVVNDVGEANF